MKAKIESHELTLTVGMIVKNEEAHLENCLSALSPLLRAVPSELIVVDTGSTDGTLEIARRFTDQIHTFEWCDDFSAARNVSMDRARGKWYLQIDSDEYLGKNIQELVAFLRGPEAEQYRSATLLLHNYADKLGLRYEDYNACRLYRMMPGLRYHGIIHECVPVLHPIKVLQTEVHHYGYVTPIVGTLNNPKGKRNRALLERQLEQKPDDLRAIRHMADTFRQEDFREMAQRERLLRRAAESMDSLSSGIEYSIVKQLIQCLLDQRKLFEAKQQIEWFREVRSEPPCASDLDYTAWMGAYYAEREQYESAIYEFEEYRKFCRLYQDGQLNTMDLFYITLTQCREDRYRLNLAVEAMCHCALKHFDEARALLDEADPLHAVNPEGELYLLEYELRFIRESGDYDRLATDYQNLPESGKADLYKAFEKTFRRLDEKKLEASRRLAALEPADAFIALNRLRAGDGGDLDGALEVLQREPDLIYGSEFFYDALYDALSNQRDISAFWEQGNPEKAPAIALRMAMAHVEYPRVLYRALFDTPLEEGLPTMRSLRWWLALEERALLVPNDFTEDEYLRLFRHYAKRLFLYCQNLYNPEIWDGDDLELLPSVHQFAYHIALAEQAEQEGSDLQYVRNLRRALSVYEAMKAPVTLLLERFQNRLEQRDRDSEEFQRLIALLKEKIRELARMGLGSDAAAVLTEYARVNPMDEELDELFELVK